MTDVLIVEATFYDDIAAEMRRGAVAALAAADKSFEVVAVPGALEIPAVLRFCLDSDPGRFAAYVALGCVIRGETTHNEHVARECMRGLSDAVNRNGIALGNGVLTCDTRAQAWARAQLGQGNKGGVAATAALHMLGLQRRLRDGGS